ncbi:27454_t:CDS:2, partial [Racocetra persica]
DNFPDLSKNKIPKIPIIKEEPDEKMEVEFPKLNVVEDMVGVTFGTIQPINFDSARERQQEKYNEWIRILKSMKDETNINNLEDRNNWNQYRSKTEEYLAIIFAEWIKSNVVSGTDLPSGIPDAIAGARTCENITDYNACGNIRPPGSLIDKIDFSDGGFVALDKRFYIYNLLQEEKNSTYQLSNDITLTKLVSPFKIDLYLVRVCDLETAKKNNLTIEDVLKQPKDIKNHQLKDNYDILLQYSVQINCSTECVFNEHEIVMCRKFLKEEQKTCEISSNTDENIVYDTANYRLIMLGTPHGQYDSGYPVFISGGNIEIAYYPDLTQVSNYINCCVKKYKEQNIIKIKKEEINKYLMLTIIEKAGQPFIQQSIQQPILFPQQPIVPISPQKPIFTPEESNDINDKNIFN